MINCIQSILALVVNEISAVLCKYTGWLEPACHTELNAPKHLPSASFYISLTVGKFINSPTFREMYKEAEGSCWERSVQCDARARARSGEVEWHGHVSNSQ